jgi:gliding motility-associated-like protein
MNSKTIVLRNQPTKAEELSCTDIDTTGMGDLKLGPDGKIYIGNDAGKSCTLDTAFVQSPTLHVINNPNQLGMACNAEWNIMTLPTITSVDFNPAIVMPPAPRDTMTSTRPVSLCFGELLQADTPGDCYQWNTGSDSSSAWVDTSEQYIVCWSSNDCAYHIDTFLVHVVQLPQLFVTRNSCANAANGLAFVRNVPGDTTTFNYAWKDANGAILKAASGNSADTFYAGPGNYFLQINTAAGCDSTLSFSVDALPVPELPYLADTAVCRGKYVQFHTSPDATQTNWVFGDGNFSTEANPLHAFGKAGTYYMAVVVTNAAGCSDTADAEIRVNELNLALSVSPEVMEAGKEVELNTSADRSYRIVGWEPTALFPEQNRKRQRIYPNETVVIFVKGISEQGCVDTARVTVYVKPELRMPTAFSPNGDGLNDYFAPFVNGKRYKVSTFQIFNRLGQMVYDGFGDAAMKGWDGRYKGKPVDAGTYFYRIAVSTEYGELLQRKGDVTVLR